MLAHKHLHTLGTEVRQNYPGHPDPWDEDHRVADAVAKLKECASRGIRTLVDPTVLGLGRYTPPVQITTMLVDNPRRYLTGAQT